MTATPAARLEPRASRARVPRDGELALVGDPAREPVAEHAYRKDEEDARPRAQNASAGQRQRPERDRPRRRAAPGPMR